MEKRKGRIKQAFAKIRKKLFSRRQPKVETKPEALGARRKHELSEMLKAAVISGDRREAGLAIKAGADINEIYELNMTPLMYAAYSADKKMCLFLIRSGADAEKLNFDGINAFTYAFKEDYAGGAKSVRDRLATCLVFLYMNAQSIVKENEWSASSHGLFWPNTINTTTLADIVEGRNRLFHAMGASADGFADAFFDCIYK
jgi:hypothetical protein